MQEFVGRVHWYAEEQILDRSQRRGLTGFIRPKNNVKVRFLGRQLKKSVREVLL